MFRRIIHMDAVVVLVEHLLLLLLLLGILVTWLRPHIGHHSILLHPLHLVVIELLVHLLLGELRLLLGQHGRRDLGRRLCRVDALGRLGGGSSPWERCLVVLVVLSNGRSVSFRLTGKFRLVEVIGICRFGQLRIRNGQGTRGAP